MRLFVCKKNWAQQSCTRNGILAMSLHCYEGTGFDGGWMYQTGCH